MIRPDQIFDQINSSGGRAKCPSDAPAECVQPDKMDYCVDLNDDYAFCHRCQKSWQFDVKNKTTPKTYELQNTRAPLYAKSSGAVDKSGYVDARMNYEKFYSEIIKILKLPWNEQSLDDRYGIGVKNNNDDAQLMFKINDEHVKYHKAAQFGANVKCKLYPSLPPVVVSGRPLFVVEGEKDAVSLDCAAGSASAVTFTSGAGALPSDLSSLDDYDDIVIAYDNDEKGREGAEKTAKKLYRKGRKIRILNWNGHPDKYDLTDYFVDGYTFNDLMTLVDKAPVFGQNAQDFGGSAIYSPLDFAAKFNNPPEDVCDQILFELGTAGVSAKTNVGKSVWALQFAICVSMGVPFLGQFRVPKARKVLYMQYEMVDDVVGGRLQLQMKPILEKYPVEARLLNENLRISANGQKDLFSDSYDTVEGNLRHGDYELIVIDNLYCSTNIDTVSNKDLVALLSRITMLKNKYKCAVLMVNHHKKQNDMVELDPALVFGGSAYTNWLDNLVQLANTKVSQDLIVQKITKVRMKSDLHWQPTGLKFHRDSDETGELYMEYLRPLPKNELFWYSQRKENDMDRVLSAITMDGDNFSAAAFGDALQQVLNISSTRSVYKWLDKLVDQGLIRKIEKGHYMKNNTELDDFL